MKANKSNAFFSKNWLGAFYCPLFFTRKELFIGINSFANRFNGKLVDLGCGTKPYFKIFNNVSEYIGLDVEQSGNGDGKSMIDIFYDGKVFPFADNSIDGIFSSETFEHIFNLDEILMEIQRVLKKGGLLLVTCPFFWPEHEVPYDFARYTSFAIKDLLLRNGFEIIEYKKTGNYFIVMLQMFALYIYYFINRIPLLSDIFFVLFITPIFILGSLINKILPQFMKRQDLYLNNVILAKKI